MWACLVKRMKGKHVDFEKIEQKLQECFMVWGTSGNKAFLNEDKVRVLLKEVAQAAAEEEREACYKEVVVGSRKFKTNAEYNAWFIGVQDKEDAICARGMGAE